MSASVQSFVKCDFEFPTQDLKHVVRPQQVHVGGALAIVLPRALSDVLIGRVTSCDGTAEAAELLEAAAPTVGTSMGTSTRRPSRRRRPPAKCPSPCRAH